MRVTTAFKRLLRLDGVNVTAVEFLPTMIVVSVALRRRRLLCPHCEHKSRFRYDTRPVASAWRHLDLGVWHLELRANLRRLRCPTHGVVVEAVPFARPGARLTRDFDDLLAWLATRMDKTATARLCRVSWRTVGRACERVVAAELDPGRLDGLFSIGVDEISWRYAGDRVKGYPGTSSTSCSRGVFLESVEETVEDLLAAELTLGDGIVALT